MTSRLPPPLPVLRQLLNEATPGPWGMDADRIGGFDLVDEDGQFIADRLGSIDRDNAALIVAAVNALPQLLAAIEAVQGLADDWATNGDGRYATNRIARTTAAWALREALSGITPTTEENP